MSGTVKAVEDINLTDDTLAELSQFVAEGHASIRRIMATPGSSADAALVGSRKPSSAASRGCARERAGREARWRVWWTEAVGTNVDVGRLEQEGRAYVTAGTTAPTAGAKDPAMGLRLFDLRAQKLIVTVAAMRDSADTARAQGLCLPPKRSRPCRQPLVAS